MKRTHLLSIVVVIALLGVGGWYGWQEYNKADVLAAASRNGVVQDNSGKTVRYWYDPMVPDQKFDKPGKSPFMDMQLIPKYADEGGGDSGVSIPSQTQQNLGIRVEEVRMASFGDSVSAVGRVEPDERKFYAVQTRIPGFVERLLVRAVGDPVAKGQKLAEIYAPDLLAAQQEYLALLELDRITDGDNLKQAARNRLKLLGMTEGEIAGITQSRQSSPRFGVYSPASGVLTELGVREGGQLMAGTSLMQISDLSMVWLMVEVPERDASRIRPGIPAEVQLQSFPDQVFKGRVGYLYPTLDDTSRTLRVRIELPNPGGRLRPGMYADVSLSGEKHEALAVPSESIIATGQRKVVIVKEEHGFRPAEVITGQERNGHTEILKGLNEGEHVVTSGQFLIDSEASLSGVLARLSQQEISGHDQAEMRTAMPQQAAVKMPHGRGKVVGIDPKSSEITLSHEPIPELGWPAMTMGFKLKDAKQLEQFKPGDQVQFDLQSDGRDQYMIDHIEKQGGMVQDTMKGSKP